MIIIFNVGDLVTRTSHNNDVLFRIISISNNVAKLLGVNVRLEADSNVEDLVKSNDVEINDVDIIERNVNDLNFDRANYFYLPGKILHIDGDEDYLERSMNFYNGVGIKANGLCLKENEISLKINDLIKEYRPDIIVITGHDAYYKKKGSKDNISSYQNSGNFVRAIKEVRKIEKNQDKLIIVAGACQSDYEELIKAGANFASSPKRINIHALDPAIIASSIAFSDKNQSIDIMKLIEKTKYGSDGIGGIITNGTMYVGYPR